MGFFSSVLKIGAPIIGGLLGGPTGAAIGAGVSGIIGASDASSAAASQGAYQQQGAQAGIDEQRRQFDALQKLLKPYVQAGTEAIGSQQDLLGLNGVPQQQTAIDALQDSPIFKALMGQGEDAILQNASATGGLRGGNTQAALATFAPKMLNELIQRQFENLGGITSIGQNSAARTGNAGMDMAGKIAPLYGDIGTAKAGVIKSRQDIDSDLIQQLQGLGGQLMGRFAGAGGMF